MKAFFFALLFLTGIEAFTLVACLKQRWWPEAVASAFVLPIAAYSTVLVGQIAFA